MRLPTIHTPGPWHRSTLKGGLIVYGPDGYAIANAQVWHGRHEEFSAEGNAQLIAAAPELLEACEWALDALVAHKAGKSESGKKCAAAIAKATGK